MRKTAALLLEAREPRQRTCSTVKKNKAAATYKNSPLWQSLLLEGVAGVEGFVEVGVVGAGVGVGERLQFKLRLLHTQSDSQAGAGLLGV